MLEMLTKVRDKLDAIGTEPAPLFQEAKRIFDVRPEERAYAFLSDCESKKQNRYGNKIDLLNLDGGGGCSVPTDRPMFINGNPAVGDNPNRNKQHGFHFTADNCIGCHACEAACSEKNGNPAHISFRSVGYVEGGTYPDYKRLNISMACNHCDDPVCLKGCPTRAYTKHAEYGAVLQDPDTCFGCGYCTWVCPYNAPQLDPIQGQVSKCNMCVDRLEVGLKPACVSACLGNALNFGVIENTPENREQTLTQIPGFPDPSITQPNIRFQQTRSMPEQMTRTDSMPVKYHKNDEGKFRSVVDQKAGKEVSWNAKRLSSRENPLVIFTTATQGVVGAFIFAFLGPLLGNESLAAFQKSIIYIPMLIAFVAVQAGVLFISTLHLGKPLRFYRGFNNLKHSPLSREALGIAMFLTGLGAYTGLTLLDAWLDMWIFRMFAVLAGFFAVISGIAGVYYMQCIYRIKARPFWNHWQTATSFAGTMLSLGGVTLGVYTVPTLAVLGTDFSGILGFLGAMIALGLIIEGVGLYFHARYLNLEQGEGAASHYIQCTTFGKTYWLRNVLIAAGAFLALMTAVTQPEGWIGLITTALLIPVVATTALVGRALFYVLVIPTTMPGAFFWKNKGFEEHARDIGLANMPQVGVVPKLH